MGDRLEFSKFGTLKVFGFLGDIYPKATLAAERTGALDCESKDIRSAWRWQVDVISSNIRSTSITEVEQIDQRRCHSDENGRR